MHVFFSLLNFNFISPFIIIDGCSPPIPYTKESFDSYRTGILVLLVISFVCSVIVFVGHFDKSLWLQNLVVGFCFHFMYGSMSPILWMSIDWNNDVSCRNKVVYRSYHPYCIFSGIVQYFSIMATSFFTVCIALQIFLTIVMNVPKKDMGTYYKYMWFFSHFLPLLSCMILLGTGNFGYPVRANPGICIVYNNDGDADVVKYSWAVVKLILNSLALVLMVLTLWRVYEIIKANDDTSEKDPEAGDTSSSISQSILTSAKSWTRVLTYNKKSLLFVALICIMDMICVSLYVDLINNPGEIIRNTEDYTACILGEAATAGLTTDQIINQPLKICGEISDHVIDLIILSFIILM